MTRKFAQIKGDKPNLYVSAVEVGVHIPCGSKEALAQIIADGLNRAFEAGKATRSAEIRALLDVSRPPDPSELQT